MSAAAELATVHSAAAMATAAPSEAVAEGCNLRKARAAVVAEARSAVEARIEHERALIFAWQTGEDKPEAQLTGAFLALH